MKRAIIAGRLCLLGWGATVADPRNPPTARPASPRAAVKRPTAKSAAQKKHGRKTLAVVSQPGDVYAVQTVGFMVFGNERKELPLNAWKIDKLAVAKVSSLLKRLSPSKVWLCVRGRRRRRVSALWR
jgi:hypothetical protein